MCVSAVEYVPTTHKNHFSGETQANADQIIQGQSDWDLNERGRQQSEAAGKALADVSFDAVLSSDLARPLQTADGILKENRWGAKYRRWLKVFRCPHVFDAAYYTVFLTALSTANQSHRHFSGEVFKWKSLRERSYGVLERRPNAELKEAAAAAGVDVTRYTPEGAETLDQMFARIKVSNDEKH